MSGGIHTCVAQSVADECLVGQGLQRCAGFGDNDEQGVGNVDGLQDCTRVVGIDVADEAGFHLESVVFLCPVLQSNIDGAGAQITSADTDLNCGGELLACRVCDLTGMDLVREIGGFFLLGGIKITLIDAVRDDIAQLLRAAELVKDQALLTGVDDSAVQKLFVLVNELMLVRKLLKDFESFVVDGLCREVVLHSACHGNAVLRDTLCAVFAGHGFDDIDAALQSKKFIVDCKRVKIFPGNHNMNWLHTAQKTAAGIALGRSTSGGLHRHRHKTLCKRYE